MTDRNDCKIQKEEKGHYSVYADYAKTLRTWLVAYGVGGPVLFLTQSDISKKIAESGQARLIICLFLVGVASQIFISFLNKWTNWYLYAYPNSEKRTHRIMYNIADWISERFWFDIIFDVVSIVTFGLATKKVLIIFTGS